MNSAVEAPPKDPAVGRVLARRAASFVIPMAAVVALDRITKSWVQSTLWDPPREMVVVPGWIELTPVANRGIAFGIMQESGGVLALVAVALLMAIAVRSWRQLLKAPALVRLP